MTAWKYLKGSERDFEGAPEWSMQVLKERGTENIGYDENINGKQKVGDRLYWPDLHEEVEDAYRLAADDVDSLSNVEIIAQREPITNVTVNISAPCGEDDLNECIGAADSRVKVGELHIDGKEHAAFLVSKYHREIKPGVWVDIYDVLKAWNVTNPALQHLIKKAAQPGGRGHKTLEQDMQDIIDSAIRAKELEIK